MVLSDPGINSISTLEGRSAATANTVVAAQHMMPSSATAANVFEPPNFDKNVYACTGQNYLPHLH